jgi:putative ABC transport system permease protein
MDMFNELRFAIRGLARTPGFTLVALVTLALGIGATTAVFTLVDSVLLRPLPYPDSDRVMSVRHEGRGGEDQLPISPGLYLLYREHARTISALAMHNNAVMNITGEDDAERVTGQIVTPSFHDVLRATPALGRPLLESDAEQGAEPVVVISHAWWQSRFGGDPAVLNSTLHMNGVARQVIGIMPRGFSYPDDEARFWIPLTVDPANAPMAAFGASGIARLSEGATVEAARAEIEGIIARLDQLRPEDAQTVAFLREVRLASRIDPLKEVIVGDLQRVMWTLLGMVGFVLLIACANVANLLLVRAEGRQRELAVRQALGGSRAAIARPFLAESLVLGLAGGGLGVGVAAAAVRITTALAPSDLPRMWEVGIDPRVLAFTAIVSLVAAFTFGMFPVLRYGNGDLSGALKEGGARGGTAGRERHRVRNTLVVAQVTLALVLLVGSGLMFRSFLALMAVDPGFRQDGILAVQLAVPTAEIQEASAVADFYRQLTERVAALPGVQAVGATAAVPLGGQLNFVTHSIEDHPTGPDELPPMSFLTYVDEGYFETMGIRIVEGRALEAGDGAHRFRAAVVSRAYAQRWWPDASAVGRRIEFGPGGPWEIVGVAENVRNRGLQEDPEELVYLPPMLGPAEAPQAVRTRELLVRVAGDPLAALPIVRNQVRELNPRIPLANPRTMNDVMRVAAAETSFTMAVLGSASVVALLLGLIGIYGVVSYIVTQRTRELGVRMALGATRGSVRMLVVRHGVTLAGIGVGVGLAFTLGASRLIESLLFGVSARDPLTYAAVAAALVLIATLASWIPARRAAGVDPAVALRND